MKTIDDYISVIIDTWRVMCINALFKALERGGTVTAYTDAANIIGIAYDMIYSY